MPQAVSGSRTSLSCGVTAVPPSTCSASASSAAASSARPRSLRNPPSSRCARARCGTAPYAFEAAVETPAYCSPVQATVARGRIDIAAPAPKRRTFTLRVRESPLATFLEYRVLR